MREFFMVINGTLNLSSRPSLILRNAQLEHISMSI